VTPDDLFHGHPVALAVARRVERVLRRLGAVDVRTTKSQVAFRRKRAFAWVWRPRQYVAHADAEAVLSIGLGRLDPSPRWKEVAHPTARQWMHHLEVGGPEDVDDEVVDWLREAADRAS
jgi:hypothetical protein